MTTITGKNAQTLRALNLIKWSKRSVGCNNACARCLMGDQDVQHRECRDILDRDKGVRL